MSTDQPVEPRTLDEAEARRALVEELEQRIEELEGLGDHELGSFTGWDWILCLIGSLVLPAVAMWWFGG